MGNQKGKPEGEITRGDHWGLESVDYLSQQTSAHTYARSVEIPLRNLASSMETEPLQNLTEQSAGVGIWLLCVANVPRPVEYTWTSGKQKGTGKKSECLLVSEDSTQYCLGRFTRRGKEPQATQYFNAAAEKFKKGSIWKVNRICFGKANKQYIAHTKLSST